MASAAPIRDERPARLHAIRKALPLAALLAMLFAAAALYGWRLRGDLPPPVPQAALLPEVIDAPFAPKALRPLSPEEAEEWNRKVPQTNAAILPATAFRIGAVDVQALSRSLQCMTAAIYYEAGNEPIDGQRAVAQVILNRMRSPVYPHSVCGVVYQGSERKTGCQFTFTCDGSLARAPRAESFARAGAVAAAALSGYVYAPVGWATNYHADYVVPYWASSLDKLGTIGRHIFYGWKGSSGTGASFTSRYAGVEPAIGPGLGIAGPASVTDPDAQSAIASITSAERPVIAFGTAPDASLAETGSGAGQAPHPDVPAASRWVIGASEPNKPVRKPPPGEKKIAGESVLDVE